MQKNSRLQKTHGVIKYKAYTALLEGKINQKEHDILVELGFMDKVKSFFGGGMEVGGDLAKLFKDKVNQKQFQLAKESITKVVADLKAIAKKAGIDESVVNEFLKGVLDEAGADPADIAAAEPSDSESDAEDGEAAAGTEVSATAIGKNPAIAAAIVADATGQPVDKVQAELEKKKPDVAAISSILGNAIGKSVGVDGKVVTDVVKTLIDKGHLKLENGNSLTRRGLMNFVNEVNELNNQYNLMERWSQLAGLNSVIITEGRSGDILKDIKSKKIKTPEELEARIKQATTDGQGGQVLKRKDEIMAAFKKVNPDVEPAEEKKIDTALEAAGKDAPPGGKEASPEDEKKEEEVKEKFGTAFKDVRAAIDPKKVDDITLTKVIDAINDFKSVAIAA